MSEQPHGNELEADPTPEQFAAMESDVQHTAADEDVPTEGDA